MNPDDFHYELSDELIAQKPAAERTASRLLHLGEDGAIEDLGFTALANLLDPGDLLVLNDTRVVPARLHGHKATGGKIEVLIERVLNEFEALAQVGASRSPADGSELAFNGGVNATVAGRQGRFFRLRFSAPVGTVLEQAGHVPLPPYIDRPDESADRERYQTVYARHPGAVAAPTAGLHFDNGQLNRLRANGVEFGHLTLHVGAGTFAPLRDEQLAEKRLHPERLTVSAALCQKVEATKAAGGRIVAVGTTVVRGLETAARGGAIAPFDGDTELFIQPGDPFHVVDALLTNFHLPGSSLLMLVSAFAGHANVMSAYAHAVEQRYRFFSYGDAMFCHRQRNI